MRRSPHNAPLLMLLAVLALASSCSDDGSSVALDDVASRDVAVTDLFEEDGQVQVDGTSCPAIREPGGDADGDGLPNLLEDRNQNCQVDPGETNPLSEDSDGDGLADGDEDIDRNGFVENGELDPRSSDSDGDGVQDGGEVLSVVCRPSLLRALEARPLTELQTSLALPPGWTVSVEAGVALLEDDSGRAFGYVAEVAAESSNVLVENGRLLLEVSRADRAVNEFTKEFTTWSAPPDLPARQAVRNRLAFRYGEGTVNPERSERDPARLRDAVAGRLTGTSVKSEVSGGACSSVTLYHVAILRSQERLLVAGVMACAESLEADARLGFLFSDFYSGTMVAPLAFAPNGFQCESRLPEFGSAVDFVWVIDNSASMAGEQERVASTAKAFMDTLDASGVDWRVGVTTSEAWALDAPGSGVDLSHDELLDVKTGLRGEGFVSAGDADAAERFATYVSEDPDCLRTDLEPAPPKHSNVCGSSEEAGLRSGLTVLERASASTDPAYALREGALRVVVWVSDEEDVDFKDADGAPLEVDAQARIEKTEALVEAYAEMGALGAAIVGDAGPEEGGVCAPLTGPGSEGAEHGRAYIDVARGLGGAFGSICNTNLQATIDALVSLGIGFGSQLPLAESPIASGLSVAVDGQLLERSRTEGWDYDPDQNAIVFFGLALDESSSIGVAYPRWAPLTQ